jgi:general secretion pathway protein I
MPACCKPAAQRGFTLLEAIVALVLITTVGMALLSWMNTTLISAQRVQAAAQRDDAIRAGLAFINTVNPLADPRGEETLGSYRIRWRSSALDGPKDGTDVAGNLSYYQVGLYLMQVEMWQDQASLAQFDVRQIGWKQVRAPTNPNDY